MTRRVWIAPALVAALVVGCSDASSDGAPDAPSETTVPIAGTTEDPRRDALVEALEGVERSVTAARDLLVEAQETGDAGAAQRAVAALTADERLTDGVQGDVAPLLPGPVTSRQETVDYGDSFTAAFEAARDAGGSLAADARRVLSDTVAGDLGAWQRDAGGVLDTASDAARGDLETAETRILELAGEGTRALAWTLYAARADDADGVSAAAERALAHLDLIRLALSELTPDDQQES